MNNKSKLGFIFKPSENFDPNIENIIIKNGFTKIKNNFYISNIEYLIDNILIQQSLINIILSNNFTNNYCIFYLKYMDLEKLQEAFK
jgi:hypothetical protein